MHVEVEDAEGPPPPPFVRRRRRRRNLAIAAVASVIVGVPLVLAVVSSTEQGRSPTDTDDPPAASDGPGADEREGDDSDQEGSTGGGSVDDGPVDDTDDLSRPDADRFDGIDAVYAQLLRDIDDSELSMIGFQEALSDAFAGIAGDGDQLVEVVQAAAGEAQDDLLDVRSRLTGELDEDGAEAVRATYLDHLDSWAEYMAAVESDPAILGSEDRTQVFTLAINVTADAFARTLDEELPSDVDDEVRQYADEILDRGFRGFTEPNV